MTQPRTRTGWPALIDEKRGLDLYRTMTEARTFEKRAYDLFMQNLVKGTTHLGTGQEAVSAGVVGAMAETTTCSSPTAATSRCWSEGRRWPRSWPSCWAGKTG